MRTSPFEDCQTKVNSFCAGPKLQRVSDLATGEVHVWGFELSDDSEHLLEMHALLSDEELARAGKSRAETVRRRFIAARGTLKAILARYLDTAPERLHIVYGEHGKPRLADSHDAPALEFNLTHSEDFALLAVAVGRALGIDLECADRVQNAMRIAARSFSKQENAALLRLPAALQQRAFMLAWTRKEAYAKARGGGFAYGFRNFSVALVPDEPAALLADERDPDAPHHWTLRDINVGAEFCAALAGSGTAMRVQLWRWPIRSDETAPA